jgi:AcrR family transcriptional regulator
MDIAYAGRRERKKLQTRMALHSAALRLTAERGLDCVTVEEIAEAADVSNRTFFNYFSSKEEAVVGHDPDEAARLRAALADRPDDEAPLESLRLVLSERARRLVGERGEDWRMRRAVLEAEPRLRGALLASWGALERALVEGVAARTGTDPDRDPYPALVVGAAAAATRVAVTMRLHDRKARSLEDLLALAFAELSEGLKPPAGTRRRSR